MLGLEKKLSKKPSPDVSVMSLDPEAKSMSLLSGDATRMDPQLKQMVGSGIMALTPVCCRFITVTGAPQDGQVPEMVLKYCQRLNPTRKITGVRMERSKSELKRLNTMAPRGDRKNARVRPRVNSDDTSGSLLRLLDGGRKAWRAVPEVRMLAGLKRRAGWFLMCGRALRVFVGVRHVKPDTVKTPP